MKAKTTKEVFTLFEEQDNNRIIYIIAVRSKGKTLQRQNCVAEEAIYILADREKGS